MITQQDLFGEIPLNKTKVVKTPLTPMQIALFGEAPQETKGGICRPKIYYTEKKKPIKSKKKATITLSYGNWGITDEERDIKEGERFTSVSFRGYNEGQGSGFNTEKEALDEVERIKKRYEDTYSITFIDERVKKEVEIIDTKKRIGMSEYLSKMKGGAK